MYQTLSFYKYLRLADPAATRLELRTAWGELGILGRIYVAHEGINAQMCIPRENLQSFYSWMKAKPELADVDYKLAVEEGAGPSFKKLIVKVREKIVADGLDDKSFDVTATGEYLSARQFNEYIADQDAVVVDMRNAYESEIGHFENAVRPEVDTFREELRVVPKLLADQKDKKIALYCTGGIRCEKASAWLRHNGFKDVKHLKGGIIDYKYQVEREGLPNLFRGKNFVFDERLGERIGEEVISSCQLCSREKSDDYYHCKNQVCHVLFIGCAGCVGRLHGYCSVRCRLFDRLPQNWKISYARIKRRYFRPVQFKKARLRSRSTTGAGERTRTSMDCSAWS